MADSTFFEKAGSFSLSELASISGSKFSGHDRIIDDVAPLETAGKDDITFFDNTKYIDAFRSTKAGACIVREKFIDKAPADTALLITEDPYYVYAVIASKFYPPRSESFISESAVIGEGVTIGNNCVINPSVSISHAVIGNNVIIHHGACIGQDGFGFAFHEGKHIKVPQLGRVIIEDNVEIGASTCIDRGSNHDTIIGSGTKIDNLVQIGHNVIIGKGCIIVAGVGIGGSTQIGDYVVIGGQAGIVGHIKIGTGVKIAAQSGVTGDIADGTTVSGTPAVPIIQYHRQVAMLRKLIHSQLKL